MIANSERARCFERHAPDHALTELTDFVFPRASQAVQGSIASDLTQFTGLELKKGVDQALALPSQ